MKLNDESMYYLGFIILVIIGMCFIFSMLSYQFKVVEGLTTITDSKKNAQDIKNKTDKILDGLLIDKYRENYEDILTNLLELTNATILQKLLSTDLKDTNEIINLGYRANALNDLKKTLNDSMKYMDSK